MSEAHKEIGKWVFDPASRRLVARGEERRLSPKAAGVLAALAETPGQVWSRDALIERVWPGVVVGEEVLTHAIAELRRALGDDFRKPRLLETVHKSGYRLLTAAAGADDGAASEGGFDLDAYAAYLDACAAYDRGGRDNIIAAVRHFEEALARGPRYAPAHVGLAKALLFIDYVHPIDTVRSRQHCTRAHVLDERSADAHAVEAMLFAIGDDASASLNSVRAALALKSSSPEILYLAARACMVALALRPAAAMLERASTLASRDGHYGYYGLVMAGKIRAMLGDKTSAVRNYAAALPRVEARLAEMPHDFRALVGKLRCLAALGRTQEAFALVEPAMTHPEPMNYHLACTLASAGQARLSLDTLERAVELGWRDRPWNRAWLDRDADFDGLRHNRRFQRIARALAP